jgi:hypothetical protein
LPGYSLRTEADQNRRILHLKEDFREPHHGQGFVQTRPAFKGSTGNGRDAIEVRVASRMGSSPIPAAGTRSTRLVALDSASRDGRITLLRTGVAFIALVTLLELTHPAPGRQRCRVRAHRLDYPTVADLVAMLPRHHPS